jgi:hypothetical protein
MDDAEIVAWKTAITTDNDQFMAGEISHDEYWSRVHTRDAALEAMSPDERARVQKLLQQ